MDEASTKKRSPCLPASLTHELRQGWTVLLAVFCVQFLVVGYSYSFGVIYVVMKDYYGSSATATSWVSGLQTVLRFGFGPVSSIIINRISLRPAAILGACIFSLGAICSSFSNSLTIMYLTYGVLIGVGASVLMVASYLIIAQYFEKHRTFAYGISNIGYSIGIFVFPVMTDVFLEIYNLSGYLLIFGAVVSNTLVCVCLFKERPRKRSCISDETIQLNMEKKLDNPLISKCDYQPSNYFKSLSVDDIAMNLVKSEHQADTSSQVQSLQRNAKGCSVYKTCHFGSVPVLYPGPNTTSEQMNTKSKPFKEQPRGWKTTSLFRLARSPLFDTLCILTTFQAMLFSIFALFIKALAVQNSIHNSTLLLSISGMADLFGNLILPLIADSSIIRPHWNIFYSIVGLGTAVSVALLPLFVTFMGMAVTVSFHAFVGSQVNTMRPSLAMDIITEDDPKLMSTLIGCMTFFLGLGHGLAPTVGGLLTDLSGDYNLAFYVAGAIVAGFTLIYGFLACIIKITARIRNATLNP